MKLKIYENYDVMSDKAKDYIVDLINQKPDSLLCLAGGSTPFRLYTKLIAAEKNGEVNFSKCKFVSLDEWVGLGIDTKGSCIETLYNKFFNQISTPKENIVFFDGKADDLDRECKRVDEHIFANNKIDIIVLGVGMNGHLGFNEPNVDKQLYSLVIPLDNTTKTVSAKYFEEKIEVEFGITLGIKHILESKNILLIADSEKKSEIIRETIEGEITAAVPSSLLRTSNNTIVYLDKSAAKKLKRGE